MKPDCETCIRYVTENENTKFCEYGYDITDPTDNCKGVDYFLNPKMI